MSKKEVLLSNAQFLMAEINWLKKVIQARIAIWSPPENIATETNEETPVHPLDAFIPPDTKLSTGVYAKFISDWQLNKEERLVLILALTPLLAPQVLDVFFTKNASYNRPITEFGGWNPQKHKGFLPTWETVYFIATGNNLTYRIELEKFFHHSNQRLFTNGILDKDVGANREPLATMPLIATQRFIQLAIFEQADFIPSFNHQFPAELYTPNLEWEELILPKVTLKAVEKIKDWIKHSAAILQQEKARKMLQPGFRVLFYGVPGTGKSLTAGLIGKTTNRLVFRVDLSKVVSKYIGETEKNLASIFDQAEHDDWILFFDEADALFGKRVKTSDAKDRYANQETAYLLQRIENFPGVVILASNQIANLDKAFARRFQAVIHFPKPGLQERVQLWKNTFEEFAFDVPYNCLEKQAELWLELAEGHPLTGANIQNILRDSLLLAHKDNGGLLQKEHIEGAIEEEVEKEGKI